MYCHFVMREMGLRLLLLCKSSGVETLPSKFCLKKKKKSTRQEEFPLGVHFLCKYVSSGWKGETSFLFCSTHHQRKNLKRKLARVNAAK